MASERRSIEEIQAEADQLTDESLEATRRMVRLGHETRAVGAKTLEQLDEQGEQLRRIDQGLTKIDRDTKQAEKSITQMEKCCGLCLCRRPPPDIEKSDNYKAAFGSKPIDTQPEALEMDELSARNRRAGGGGASNGGYIKRVTNDAREDEMDENLGEVSSIVRDLRQQALAMDAELSSQNKMLDNINAKADSDTARVQTANQRVAGLLRS